MAVKYRIEYCNASNDTARLDIYVRDYSGSIIPVEGSADLFLLEYKADNYIVSSIADIQIYNSESFNIDVLKTSDETELKALFYVNGILKWSGFILPDFFSTELTDNSVISMTATDRLSVLKDVTLAYSTQKLSYIKLISDCLIKTGLEMDINVVADFMLASEPSSFNIMNCYVEHSRITSRNKSLSAYDVLKSVLILLNAKLMQYGGAWWIVNRYQAQTTGGRVFTYNEAGVLQTSGTFTPQQIPFSMVDAGGRRTIEPVASQTSVFMEFGGAKRYPADYEFKNYSGGYEGWTAVNSFNYTYSDKEVLSYNSDGGAIYGTRDIEPRMRQYNDNTDFYLLTSISISYLKYLKSTPVTNNIDGKIKVNVMLNATGMNDRFMPILIVIDTKNADTTKRYYAYGRDGIVSLTPSFVTTVVNISAFQFVRFSDNEVPATSAINAVSNLNIELDPSDVNAQTLVGADISLFMFGAGCNVFVNEASMGISNISDGKGVLYRVEQGAGNYTKKHDTDTTIFGDHILQGINGFFYNYTSDELSIHTYLSNRINGGWISPGDTQADSVLLHSVRQRARMYSKAKNVFNVQITEAFNPLGIYTCGGNSYIIRSAKHNFLRSETNVELEEIVYQDLSKIDFVYTYFGDEKDKSISGVSGISGTSGGGTSTAVPSHDNLKGITTITDTLEDGATTIHLTKEVATDLLSTIANFNSWFELDTTVTPNAIKVTKDFYSIGEIAAFGYGGSGGSGGGGGTIYNLHQLAGESISSSPADKSRLEYNAITGKWENKAGLDLSVYATKTELNTGLSSIPWSSITGEPTTLLGYGITDAVTLADFNTHVNSNLHLTSGQRTLLANTTAYFTTELETKLNGIAAEANNYTHPATHAPSIIAQDANNRFVTDINIATWNSKANGTHGHYKSDIIDFEHEHYKSDIIDFAHTHSFSEIGITGLSENHLTMYDGSTLVSSILIDDGDSLSVTGSGNINIYAGKIGYNPTVSNFDSGGMNYAEYGLSINAQKVGLSGYYGLALFTGNEERISILSNGNVGIGTTTPSKPLTIQNDSSTIRLQAATNPSDYFTDITARYDAVNPFDINIKNYGVVMAVGTPSGYSGASISYMNGYYGSALLGRDKFGVFVDPDGNVGISTTIPTATLDVNGIGKFKDDILMTFKTTAWSYDTSKSLKLFLDKFDIDANGNLVVLGNLYGTGEFTAYSSGTGVAGLKLMGDLDANGKNITNVGEISSQYGLVLKAGDTNWFILADDGIHNMYGEYAGLTSLSAVNLFASSSVTSSEFKFGNYSFKQSGNGLSICFNGVEQAYITNTGQYVNS